MQADQAVLKSAALSFSSSSTTEAARHKNQNKNFANPECIYQLIAADQVVFFIF